MKECPYKKGALEGRFARLLESGTAIGRYVVQEKLAEGGMAEIYLASAMGAEGFAKDVVIKVVRPYLGTDEQFVQMFIAEARLASKLNHANIVQIFDFGKHDERYFLAMEYVRGASLWDLRKRCREMGVPFPPTLAAEICAQVARGLHYAHSLTEGGRRLGVVHRDVTPHNVLLSFDGAVKLTDFGIAKATTSHTAPGMLKGKFAYMSPEQSRGDRVDARTDVFALGIVLWELLTGGRLFDGDSDVAVLRAVQDSLIAPPTRLNPDVPQELSDVVMKALSRRVEERFQSAQEFERALATFVLRSAQAVEDTSVSLFLQELYHVELNPEATLERGDTLPPPDDSYGSGDTHFLDRLKAPPNDAMTLTPGPSVPARATPRPIQLDHVAGGSRGQSSSRRTGSGVKTAPLPSVPKTGDTTSLPPVSARSTEPMPSASRVFGTVRIDSSPSQRFRRFPVSDSSVAEASKAKEALSDGPLDDELPDVRPRPIALFVALGVAALAIAGGAVTMALWPSEPRSAARVQPAEAEAKEAEAERGTRALDPKPSQAKVAPVVEKPSSPPVEVPTAAPTEEEQPETASDTARPPVKRAPEGVRPVIRMGRLTVKAVPFAVVTVSGKQMGEVVGSQTFQLRPGPYEVELAHTQKHKRQSVTIRPNEETRVEFNAAE